MSNKIQILNETQVNHFFNLLVPEFEKEFSKIEEELLEEVKKIKDNFVTHAEVVKLKEEHQKTIEITNKLILINKTLKEIDKDLRISKKYCSDPSSTEKDLENLLNSHKEEIENLIQRLAKESLHVN
jgi:shikimate kinase